MCVGGGGGGGCVWCVCGCVCVFTGALVCAYVSVCLRTRRTRSTFQNKFNSGMTSFIDKVISASIPSYDLSIGANLLFNSSDIGEDDSNFMVSRLKLASAIRDRRKMDTVGRALITPISIL